MQLLVDCASTALRSVIATAPPPLNPRPVVLAPVPRESQELELVALAAALAANRVGHRLFGAGLPSEGLAAAVRRSAPAAVVLWAEQAHYASPRVLEDIPITRQRARAFVAGAGWSSEALPAHVERLGPLEAAVARVRKPSWAELGSVCQNHIDVSGRAGGFLRTGEKAVTARCNRVNTAGKKGDKWLHGVVADLPAPFR